MSAARSLRDQAGQAVLEWIGVLVLVAIIVAGVVKLGFASHVAASAKTSVCKIVSAKCASPPPPTTTATTPTTTTSTAPTTGPPIDGGVPFPILPFNGMTVTVTGQIPSKDPEEGEPGAEEPGEGEGGTEGSFKITAKGTVTDARGNPTLGPNCVETEQLSLTAGLSVTAKAGVKKGGTGGSVTAGAGTNVSYQLNVTPGQVNDIRSGAIGTPNPLDPRTIPSGDSIVLNESAYNEFDLGASYKDLTASLGFQKGRQLSSGIKSLGNGEMQIDVGDSELVQNSMTLGVGNDDVGASVSDTDNFTDGKVREIDININTPAGWNTYQQFLHTGKLPTAADAGASKPATQDVVTDTSTLKAEAHLLGLSVGFSSNPSQLNDTETDNADGSKSLSFNYRLRDVSEVVTSNKSASGATTGTTYDLLIHNASATEANNYRQIMGESNANYSGNQDLDLSFSAAQLNHLQQMAYDDLSVYSKQSGQGAMTPAQVKAYLQKNPDAELYGMNFPTPPLGMLATAKNPGMILQALQNSGQGNADSTLSQLEELQADTIELAHPGVHNITPYLHPLAGDKDCGKAS